eukprot:scaffold660133_cov94-Prasinocladus_malaysianus.AAC.1
MLTLISDWPTELDAVHRDVMEQIEDAMAATREIQSREEELKVGVDAALLEKHKMLLYTSHQQKMCKRFEDALAGQYRPQISGATRVEEELHLALEQQEKICLVIDSLIRGAPEISDRLER